MLSPIILFVYNRPEHTRKTLESLEKNDLAKESELFIYADGPKEKVSNECLENIKETRKIIYEKQWCGKVNIIERDKNMGLANSVITGVTEIINKLGKVIVLEDDLLLSKNFLKYMNDALDKFENEANVMQISGYMFPVEIQGENDAFFLPFTTSWGWATWKRVWDNFDGSLNGKNMLDENKELRKKFDLSESYPYYKMLKMQEKGKVDSWAIRFYLNVFLKNGLILYPQKTMVNNIGLDGSGIHCSLEVKQGIINNNFVVKKFSSPFLDEKIESKIIYFLKNNNIIARIFNTLIKKFQSYIYLIL